MFEGIERGNANRVAELAGEEVGDDGIGIGPLDLDFAVNGSLPTHAVDDEVDGLIRSVGYHRSSSRHGNLQRNGR